MTRRERIRAVLAAGAVLALVAAVAIAVAGGSSADQSRYVTATAGLGDVTQTVTASGTVTRSRTRKVAFGVTGTVKDVRVNIGDRVEAGAVLATLRKGPLQLDVLEAETAVAQRAAALYAVEHPSATAERATTGSSGAASSRSSGITIDPAKLNAAVARVSKAVQSEASACAPVFGAAPAPSSSATPSPSPSPSIVPTPSASATPTPSPSVPPGAEPTATASPLALIEANDPSADDLRACGAARGEVQAATRNLQLVATTLTRGGSPPAATPTAATPTPSAASVAAAKASLLQAQQELRAARDRLDAAELISPHSGVVGAVTLTSGRSADGGAVTVVGGNTAQVTLSLPLESRRLITVGHEVTVNPPGATTPLTGWDPLESTCRHASLSIL